jgi:hypothetical protein
MSAMRYALELARKGLPVFPVLETKAPACPGGFKSATADAAGVVELWRRHPAPLVGVPTGEVSGLDVLDIDPRHGGDRWLNANRHLLPITREHRTRSGGWHIFFRHRPGLRNSAGLLGAGVDIRAAGGYVVWWPAAGLSVEDPTIIADWPPWISDRLEAPRNSRPVDLPTVRGNGYASAALRHAVQAVGRAVPGNRNDILNREAFGLSRFALAGDLDAQHIANALATAGIAAGLPEREVAATLRSALRAAGIAV